MSITLTGIDEATNLDEIRELLMFGVEIGILYSGTPDQRNRYPEIAWIERALRYLHERISLGALSLHICGRVARARLLNGGLADWMPFLARIQINGVVTAEEVQGLTKRYRGIDIITQHAPTNYGLTCLDVGPRHSVLIDGSGGRGVLPDAWPILCIRKPVGFAGGLGPENLAEQLPRILPAAQTGWWIDMESSLRDDQDRFSTDRAFAALKVYRDTMDARVPF